MIEPVRGKTGQPRARVVCDECGREDCIPAPHKRGRGQDAGLVEGVVLKKLRAMGWNEVHKKLLCPTCEAKRRAFATGKCVSMEKAKTTGKKEEGPREPTTKQRREIIAWLEEAYDDEAKQYIGGETDDTVANDLNVMPGWVAKIREEFFGPSGENEDIKSLAADLEKAKEVNKRALTNAEAAVQQIKAESQKIEDYAKRLSAIRDAIGKRTPLAGAK